MLALLSCFVQPYSPSEVLYGRTDVLLVSGTLGQLRHRPIRPFPAVGSSRNRSPGFMEFIEFKEVYGVFLEGLWGGRQKANCGVVDGANRTPHVPSPPLLVDNTMAK